MGTQPGTIELEVERLPKVSFNDSGSSAWATVLHTQEGMAAGWRPRFR
jgi:hypothetical protein